MLKVLGLLFKFSLFSILVLVLGNVLSWNGRTISDQVRTSLSQVERAADKAGGSEVVEEVKDWTGKLVRDARDGAGKRFSGNKESAAATTNKADAKEEIPSTEREKLRSLIQQLNRSYGSDSAQAKSGN